MSKALTAGVYSSVITLVGGILILSIPYLWGMDPVPCTIPVILQYLFWLWLPHWAFALMAVALVLLTRSNTLGIILSITECGLTGVLVGTLTKSLHWPSLEQYLLASVVKGLYVPHSGIQRLWLVLACSLAWASVYGIGSLLTMEKRDI